MFERLAGKLLSRLLSKYFVSDDSVSASNSSSSSWSNLGVWSGYVSLQGLELRKEVVNTHLKSKGLPFELLQCTLGRVEITVPWAKLGLSSSTDGDVAVVVVVVDGVHALMRTNYEFDDDILREAAIQERRQELRDAEVFGKEPETSYSSNLAGFLQKRLAEGILKDILEKLHIHIRDVHVRLEDIQSDPANPCAVGVTFESLHVQADDVTEEKTAVSPQKEEQTPSSTGIIRKVAQLNHFAVYWNALDYGEGLPTELSVLQDTMVMESSASLAAALDRCISRRAASLSSPLRARPAQTTPNHSFLLLPLDAKWNTKLSTDPRNLEVGPALDTSLHIDDLSLQLRDFQCSQISILTSAVKEHSFTRHYRKHRPILSAEEDPRAWWKYAFRIVQMELHKNNMRWSWSRFSRRYELRKRYCELYERERRCQVQREQPRSSIRSSVAASSLAVVESMSSLPSQDTVSELSSFAVPDEGMNQSVDVLNGINEPVPLTDAEIDELTALEDGTCGDLSVQDIVLFRALINARVRADRSTHATMSKSRLRRLMSSFISDDIESEEEYERLMAYIEQARATHESLVSPERASSVAVLIHVNLGRGCISLFSPLRSTEDLNQHRRIQQRFLDLSVVRFQLAYSLFGNYESTHIEASLADVVGSEYRSNHSTYTIISRFNQDHYKGTLENGSGSGTPQTSNVHPGKRDLANVEIHGNPLDSSDCDVRFNASLQALEILLLPDGEWFHKVKKLASSKRPTRGLSSFWRDIGMVQINSLASRRAGLLAKVNTVIMVHKNLDMDVLLRCPLVRVGDGQGNELLIDPGRAHLVTERLAGVATGKLLVSKARKPSCAYSDIAERNGEAEEARRSSSTLDPDLSTDGSTTKSPASLTPKMGVSDDDLSSPRREIGDSFFFGGSAMSVIGGNRMSTRSFYGNVPFGDDQGSEDFPSRMDRGLHSSFYDEFRLEISDSCVYISKEDGRRRLSLLDNVEAQVSIANSVIPSDHTLCRMRTHCVVQDVSFRVSKSSISCLAGLFRSWTEAVATKRPTMSFYSPSMAAREGRIATQLGLPSFDDTHYLDLHERFSDASSVLNEAEFIDALEGDETDDAPGAWFDDNWIADAESVVDSDIRSVAQRKRSRRKTSMSDVSSISDRSLGTRRRETNNQYLSAENLAKLEELVSEEEDGDSDADSFQSALSIGGQAALATEVEEHVRRAEKEVRELRSRLASEAKCTDGSPFLIPEALQRSQARKKLRVELDRARAELGALRATHEDLLSQLKAAEALRYDEKLEGDQIITGGEQEIIGTGGNELNARAMALVRARKRRSLSYTDDDYKHQLTTGLNRELVRASLVISKIMIIVGGLDCSRIESDEGQTCSTFELHLSQFAAGTLVRANESRFTASIDGISASTLEGVDTKGSRKRQHLVLGGSSPPFPDSSRAGYDAPLAAAEDRVLVFTFDRKEKPVAGRSPPRLAQGTKIKIHVGEVEIVPREESLATLTKFVQNVSSNTVPDVVGSAILDEDSVTLLQRLRRKLNGGPDTNRLESQNETTGSKVEYRDLSFRLSSLRVTLGHIDNTVASILLTETGGRFLHSSTSTVYADRNQLDFRCNNVQLFDLYRRPSGLELLGCRDPYNPVAQIRIRSQLVPLTQTAGWVVGDNTDSSSESLGFDELARNIHIGAKLNSVFATISPEGLKRAKLSLQTVISLLSGASDNAGVAEPPCDDTLMISVPSTNVIATSRENMSHSSSEYHTEIPIRWRLDFVAKKISILFPSALDVNEIEASHPHLTKGNALLSFSLHSWMQAAPRRAESLFLRSSLSDISLVRTSDDWPLLETTSMASDIVMSQKKVVNRSCTLRLSVPDSFSWSGNRSLSVGQAGHLDPLELDGADRDTMVLMSISPLRFNIAAQTGVLLSAVLDCMKKVSATDEGVADMEKPGDQTSIRSEGVQGGGSFVKLSTEAIELKLLRESERSTCISFADPLATLVALQVSGSMSSSMARYEAMAEVGDLCLYDLSSPPGARVFGLDDGPSPNEVFNVCSQEDDDPGSIPRLLLLRITRSQDEDKCVNLDIRLGKMQCLVIPSFLQSLLSFQRAMGVFASKQPPSRNNYVQTPEEDAVGLAMPFGGQQFDFSLRVTGFECLLPTRDLFSYIRSRSKEAINVVAFRWKSLLTGKVSCPSKSSTFDFSLFDSLPLPADYTEEGSVLVEAILGVEEFQVLRTSVRRRPFPRSAAGGPHISPCSFMVDPPIAGEQRITNPFWFRASYQFAAVSGASQFPDNRDDSSEQSSVDAFHVSQALQVSAGFVDALVYIKQSEGGMNNAVRVTVKPIMDMLKQRDDPEKKKKEEEEHYNQSNSLSSKLSQAFKCATTVCSLHSDGIQVTCVPGGATRLTESPIAKCELSDLKLALVGVALPMDPEITFGSTSHMSAMKRLRQAGLERIGVVEPTISSGPVSHMTLGGWMKTELSASYHNRRLVAWEPFIEPWILNARLGIDLVRAVKAPPSPWLGVAKNVSHGGGVNEKASETIRDIGRLLRSPFSPSGIAKVSELEISDGYDISLADLSYLMMNSISPRVVESAVYSAGRRPNAYSPISIPDRTRSRQLLPGTNPAKWLERFGHPSIVAEGEKLDAAAVVCSISDSRPLNINLTGALIENLLGFLGGGNRETIQPTAPHVIRNFSGLTMRFQECLDTEQIARGELAKKTIVSTGSEIPLSLKRSLSQSCDPHRAYIYIELGSFEDTAGRINHHAFEVTARSRTTTFFYKAVGKIPVDTVGVRRYALCHQFKRRTTDDSDFLSNRQNIGYIIVRVDLQGSTKLVSIESPLVLKNNAEVDLLCELRNHGGVSLLWRSLIPRASTPMPNEKIEMVKRKYISLPADLVGTAASAEATLSVRALSTDSSITHESDVPREPGDRLVPVNVPPPFSDKSVARGLIKVFETTLDSSASSTGIVSLSTCAVRIGSISLHDAPEPQTESDSSSLMKQALVPEQRMLFFRPSIVIRNHLPTTVSVQGRVNKKTLGVLRRTSSTALGIADIISRGDVATNMENTPSSPSSSSTDWNDLGILECGKSLSWTGAAATEGVEIRVRFTNKLGEPSRKFPEWSTPVTIPSQANADRLKQPSSAPHTAIIGQMTVVDDVKERLQLSASLEFGSNAADTDSMPKHDVCWFSRTLPAAPRVVGLFVPFWIIDSTGHDLEFSSNSAIAGQSSRCSQDTNDQSFGWKSPSRRERHEHLGLAELLDDNKLSLLSSKTSFEVFMIGEKKSSRLTMRRRMTRFYDDDSSVKSTWCDPVTLRVRDGTFADVFVPAPSFLSYSGGRASGIVQALEPLALGSRILAAPEEFGGVHGTKLVHVSCRYRLVNEMGREIEVLSEYGKGDSSCIGIDGTATPFHFNGSSPIRFRPKEFGWGWSGRFSIRKKRKEVTLRLVHKLRGQVIIAEVEFLEATKSGGNILIFREASHPPFRVENQTMQAIHFAQSSVLFGAERGQLPVSLDSTILPYHHADFAWDEPDEGRRYLVVEVADLGNIARRHLIGRFKLDCVAPGNRLRLADSNYFGQIVADGPTRVLRITDSSLPLLPTNKEEGQVTSGVFTKPGSASGPPSIIELRLSHGLGVSVVDWVPQELLYIKLDDIVAERRVDATQEHACLSIGCVSVDNQMWVTAFPVLMRMGRRPHPDDKVRKRRNNALSASWRRSLNTQRGLVLLENVELFTEPVILCVDGYLSERLWSMARQMKGMSELTGGTKAIMRTRDSELRKVLEIKEDHDTPATSSTRHGYQGPCEHDARNDSFLATAVVAAKLRKRPRSESISLIRPSRTSVVATSAREQLSQRSKYYVGKWKMSTLKSEISWTGPLPSVLIKFPDIIRPALTFESLPVMMRPFTISHAYGTADDLVHDLKLHYLSIWRVFDVLVGLTFRPTFLLRACIYTWRESLASVFDSISNSLGSIEKTLERLSVSEATPLLDEGGLGVVVVYASKAYQRVVTGSLLATASVFHKSARFTSAISNSLRYSGSARNPASYSVRARNPRLFAHVEGKELLVEYVEGENAGKAILSRVRMGRHLGEGHVFYCEGVHLQVDEQSPTDMNSMSASLICMVTSERVFLLNGDRHENFCSVVWESTFLNLVEVEYDEFAETAFDLVKLWYLVDTAHAKGNKDNRLVRYSKAMVADTDYGLDILLCKSILVPKESGSMLRSKIAKVHRRLDEAGADVK